MKESMNGELVGSGSLMGVVVQLQKSICNLRYTIYKINKFFILFFFFSFLFLAHYFYLLMNYPKLLSFLRDDYSLKKRSLVISQVT